jgi:hypothetical protein
MKSTVVPAQVTTVEDKIAGNLTFNQMLLMTTPVFVSGVIFAFLPPFMSLSGYKLVLAVTFALVCLTLAIRIKGRIVLSWIMVLSKYNARPRYYVYNKNDIHLRTTTNEQTNAPSKQSVKKKSTIKPNKIKLPMKKMVWAEEVAINPSAQLEFRTTKKGDLRVYIQEIK